MGLMMDASAILRNKETRIPDRTETGAHRSAGKNAASEDVGIEEDERAQVRIHNGKRTESVWKENSEFLVKYRGKNYEISDLLKKHPGGRDNLRAFRGLTLDKILKDVPHSNAALHFFEDFVVDNKREYDDIENLVDWNEPLLPQVGGLAERYWEWVNLPVNRSIRLFKSDLIEILTITPWYIVPMVWIPISVYFLYLGIVTNNIKHGHTSLITVLLAISFGILLWTFMEYVIHRKVFHLEPPSTSKTLIILHFLFHGLHHKAPFDSQRLLFPPTGAVLVAAIFYKLYLAVLPETIVNFVAVGTMTGYLCYDLIHYYLHYGNPKAESHLYVMKRYHNHHHFTHHNQGFGISSRLWDTVFGSLITLKQLTKPIVW